MNFIEGLKGMKFRTIICDDNELVRDIYYHILFEHGHEVYSFGDAQYCPLNAIFDSDCNNVTPCSDILISDVSMPQVNGLDFVENLHAKGCKIEHIALISGYWADEDISRAKQLGCSVFHKPMELKDLCEWLAKCEANVNPQRVLSDKYANFFYLKKGLKLKGAVLH